MSKKNAEWQRPLEIRYTVAFDGKAWRKVHPPHLAAAVAAGEAAIKSYLESVTPYPYKVADVSTEASYASVMWDSRWDDGSDVDEE